MYLSTTAISVSEKITVGTVVVVMIELEITFVNFVSKRVINKNVASSSKKGIRSQTSNVEMEE